MAQCSRLPHGVRPPSSSPSVGQHSRHVEELKGIISDAFAEVEGKAEENY